MIEHNCGKVRRVKLETSSRPMLASTQRLDEYEMMLKKKQLYSNKQLLWVKSCCGLVLGTGHSPKFFRRKLFPWDWRKPWLVTEAQSQPITRQTPHSSQADPVQVEPSKTKRGR